MQAFGKLLQRIRIVVVLFASTSPVMALEQPQFTLLATVDGVEYRHYADYLVVETRVAGVADYQAAANIGFRRLFDYISGANTSQVKIDMTAPVEVSSATNGEKIAMTAPVQQAATSDGWLVSFVVPSEYSLDTAPVPQGENVSLRKVAGQLVAVHRFSGRWTARNMSRHRQLLLDALAVAGVTPLGESRTAAYNAPFVPPFLRRNEILIPVDRLPSSNPER